MPVRLAAILLVDPWRLLALCWSGPFPVKEGARDWVRSLDPGGWMAWTFPTALFFLVIACLLITLMAVWEYLARRQPARRHPALRDDARRPSVHLAARQRLHPSRLAGA
jgi:hypothetical protein